MQPLATPTIADHLTEPPYVAEPQVSGPLAVFPLIGPVPELEYVSFAQGIADGVKITEREGHAAVNDLTVHNATAMPVLLFEGEEVLGAQQNRTFDTSILVPAGARLDVPVSCVEAGRWDGSRHSEAFSPAPQTAHPALRRLKNEAASAARAASLTPRANQGAVWSAVSERASMLGADAPTDAMHDVFDSQRSRLDALSAPIEMCCSQTGMLVAIGGEFVVLDRISQPDVLDSLFAPLVQGYALDALNVPEDTGPPTVEAARAFLEQMLTMSVTEHDGIGLGRELRVTGHDMAGAGLVAENELVQLSVFVADGPTDEPRPSAGRIVRPSRRRI